ncbi:MAG: chromosome segregation protein SMC [Luteitalea sp.]|nr:chromosome segregation protein SMC [Luteitalea sp.]
MRLQRLKLTGFKSFPDAADLHFDRGVTAIVGPNGCGKSNVVDAITWVLGEQSARSLRGERMEDVIFAGSDARRPTGAAEVKLRLSGVPTRVPAANGQNGTSVESTPHDHVAPQGDVRTVAVATIEADGNGHSDVLRDVEISRRLYRSGESEYLIDGHVVRLRDVQDLLMDSGLGVKAYAVIEQGKIGQILSAKPLERRQLIEEAAGITKYKSRRRAAELKLDAAQQNLVRVEDIIYELEKQRGALKRQAAKARRYRRLREELRYWEKILFAARYRVLQESVASAHQRLAEARERETGAAARVAQLEAELERLRLDLTQADEHASHARTRAHQQEIENERRQQQLEFDRQQVDSLQTLGTTLRAELATLDARREPARQEIETRRSAGSEADGERDRAAERLAVADAEVAVARQEIDNSESVVEQARHDVYAGLHSMNALRHAIEHAATQQERISGELARLEVEASDLAAEHERVTREQTTAAAELAAARDTLASTERARLAQEEELEHLRADYEEQTQQARAKEKEISGLEARLRSLEELNEARAAYSDAARFILAEEHPEIPHAGSVADYVDVDSRYETAVEAALGDLLQCIIVPRHADALAALALVRERGLGRCGVLVADGAPRAVPAPLEGRIGDIVPLAGVLQITGAHANLIRHATGEVWVAEGFERAVQASLQLGGVVVTLAGELVRGGYLVTGGGRVESRGILGTRREIKELGDRLQTEQALITKLGDDVTTLAARVADGEKSLAALTADAHAREKEILGLEHRVARAVEDAERVSRRQELIENERRRADEERGSLGARQRESQQSIADLETSQRALDTALAAGQQRTYDARERMSALLTNAAEAKAAHAAMVERASALATEIRRLEEASAELEARIAGRRQELDSAERRSDELAQRISETRQQLDADLAAFDGLLQDVRAADARVVEIQSNFQSHEASVRGARHELDNVRAEVSRIDVERATAEADLAHLAAACDEALQMTLDAVAAEADLLAAQGAPQEAVAEPAPEEEQEEEEEEESEDGLGASGAEGATDGASSSSSDAVDAEAARAASNDEAASGPVSAEEQIARLKRKIAALGPVNMIAIEQFEELETRHTFLTNQRQDLVDAIAQTGEAIRRIDKTTRERFHDAFVAINRNFEETFRTLFGGGQSGLILNDEENVLESGIDIVAQPPGKRLQNVQLLSGGEKALTAMALMFAIFTYRPSPFCLLDEIDAPLDDANIGRFIEMLRGMQERTQFILVTHNRKTMEIADRLYGVTMEEPGVSKLISLRLN